MLVEEDEGGSTVPWSSSAESPYARAAPSLSPGRAAARRRGGAAVQCLGLVTGVECCVFSFWC